MKYILFIFIALISCNREMNPGGIEITNAWIREAPPGATVAVLYLEVKNNGPQDHILSISSPVSEIKAIKINKMYFIILTRYKSLFKSSTINSCFVL